MESQGQSGRRWGRNWQSALCVPGHKSKLIWWPQRSQLSIFQIPPILSNSKFHHQGHRKRMNVFHLLAYDAAHDVELCLRNFEHEFVVDLQGHSRLQFTFEYRGVNADHRQFDQIGGGPLQRCVYRGPISEPAQVVILAIDVGNWTDPAKECFHAAFAARLLQCAINERTYAFVLLKVGIAELFRFGSFYSKIL